MVNDEADYPIRKEDSDSEVLVAVLEDSSESAIELMEEDSVAAVLKASAEFLLKKYTAPAMIITNAMKYNQVFFFLFKTGTPIFWLSGVCSSLKVERSVLSEMGCFG